MKALEAIIQASVLGITAFVPIYIVYTIIKDERDEFHKFLDHYRSNEGFYDDD